MDLSNLSNEELLKLANGSAPTNMSSLSDAQLLALAGKKPQENPEAKRLTASIDPAKLAQMKAMAQNPSYNQWSAPVQGALSAVGNALPGSIGSQISGLKPEDVLNNTVQGYGRSIAKGTTFGLAPRAEAALTGQKLSDVTSQQSAFEKANPYGSAAAELIPSMLTGGGLLSEAGQVGTKLGLKGLQKFGANLASNVGTGATLGAAGAYGSGQNVGQGALIGGAGGGTLGALGGALGATGLAAQSGLEKLKGSTLGQAIGIGGGDTGFVGKTGKFVRGFEDFANAIPGVNLFTTGKREAQAGAAKNAIEQMTPLASVGKEGFGAQTEDVARQGFQKIQDDLHNSFNAELFDKLPQGARSQAVAPESLQYMKDNLDRLSSQQQAWVQRNIIDNLTDPKLSIERLKNIKGTTGNLVYGDQPGLMKDQIAQDFLHKFYNVAKNDEKTSIMQSVPKEQQHDIVKAWENSNAKYTDYKNSGIGKTLKDFTNPTSDTKLGAKLIGAVDTSNKGDMALLNKLQETLSPEQMEPVRQSIIRNRFLPEGKDLASSDIVKAYQTTSEEGKNFLFGDKRPAMDALVYQMKTLGRQKLTPDAEKTKVTEFMKALGIGGAGIATANSDTAQQAAGKYGTPLGVGAGLLGLASLNPRTSAKVLQGAGGLLQRVTPYLNQQGLLGQ